MKYLECRSVPDLVASFHQDRAPVLLEEEEEEEEDEVEVEVALAGAEEWEEENNVHMWFVAGV
jgi:hypothetical protein